MTTASRRGVAAVRPAPGAGPLLDGKLEIPRPTFPVLSRPHLIERLDQAARHRVTLLCASPGAGKTVACASWATASGSATTTAERQAVAWLTVDRADNDPSRFWSHVVAALARSGASTSPPDLADLADLFGPSGLATALDDEFFHRLIEAVSRFEWRTVLVLDDIHELTAAEVLSRLDFVVRHAPPVLRLVLSGRRRPDLQLARLRVAGDLVDVDGADLRCGRAEVPEYLSLFGLHPDTADCDELLRRTEGWMAGLRLMALRMREGPAGAGVGAGAGSLRVHEITGDDPLVADYLRDEVLDRLSPEVRHFLLRTCVVDELTGQLADALTGGFGGAQILDRLARENGLVQAVDPGRTRFRCHRLLRECLRAELQRELPHEAPGLLAKAARWYARHGRPLDALRCSVAAEDWDHTALVLAEEDVRILSRAGRPALEWILRRIPAERMLADPALATAVAATRLWAGDPQDADAYLGSAGDLLTRTSPPTRRLVVPKLAALRMIRACAPGRPDAASLASAWEATREPADTPAEHRARGILCFFLGMAHLRASEIERAGRALRTADRELGRGSARDLQVRARTWWALTRALAGDLNAAEQAITGDGTPPAALAAVAELALAAVRWERDDLAGARQLLDGIDTTVDQLPGEPPLDILAGLLRARVLAAQGEMAAAAVALPRRTGTALTELIDLTDAEIAVRRSDVGRARALLAPHEGGGAGRSQARVLLGRLLLDGDDPEGAAAAVDELVRADADAHADADAGGRDTTLRERTGALLVAAATRRRLHTAEQAAELLERALSLAEPAGACRVFLDGGTTVRSLLTVLVAPHSRNVRFRNRVLRRFDSQLPVGGPRRAGSAHGLTGSELAVLRFLPSHMTNDEIASALFLSVNTVKTHLRSVYRKLGVGTRRAAIAQATRLGLL